MTKNLNFTLFISGVIVSAAVLFSSVGYTDCLGDDLDSGISFPNHVMSFDDQYDVDIVTEVAQEEEAEIDVSENVELNYVDSSVEQVEACQRCVLSDDDLFMLARMVETETYGKSVQAKQNVACVAINRLLSGRFSDTISEIITAEHQFVYFRTDITDTTYEAISLALLYDTVGGACYFHSNDISYPFFGTYVTTDEVGHHFFR